MALIRGSIDSEVREAVSNRDFEIKNIDKDASRISNIVDNFLFKVVDINTYTNSNILTQFKNGKICNYE